VQLTNQKHIIIGTMLALSGTLLFSTKSIFIKQAYAFSIDPVSLMFLRMAMSIPFYLIIYLFYSGTAIKMNLKEFFLVCITGCIGYYIASYLDLTGLLYISASFERVILYTFPTIVLLLSVVFFKHRINRHEIAALAFSYAGLMIIYFQDFSTQGNLVTQGALLVFASAFAFAIFVVASGQLIARVGAIRFTSFSMLSASVAIAFHYTFSSTQRETGLYDFPSEIYILAFILALFCTVLPSYLINMGIQRIGAAQSAIISTISPVFTIILAIIFLNETSTLFHLVGFTFVIGGIGILTFAKISLRRNKTELKN